MVEQSEVTEFGITQAKLRGEGLPGVLIKQSDVAYIHSLYWKKPPLNKFTNFGPLTVPGNEHNPRERKPVTVPVYGYFMGNDQGNDNITPHYVAAIDAARDVIQGHEQFGVWASESAKPDEKDIEAALQRLEQFYIAKDERAQEIWAKTHSPRFIDWVDRAAAEFLGYARPWLVTQVGTQMCPNPGCQHPVPENASKCQNCGTIIDWKRAWEFGQVSKQDAMDHGVHFEEPVSRRPAPRV